MIAEIDLHCHAATMPMGRHQGAKRVRLRSVPAGACGFRREVSAAIPPMRGAGA